MPPKKTVMKTYTSYTHKEHTYKGQESAKERERKEAESMGSLPIVKIRSFFILALILCSFRSHPSSSRFLVNQTSQPHSRRRRARAHRRWRRAEDLGKKFYLLRRVVNASRLNERPSCSFLLFLPFLTSTTTFHLQPTLNTQQIGTINEFRIPAKVIEAAVRAAGGGGGSKPSTSSSQASAAAAASAAALSVASNPSDARGVAAENVRVALTWYYRPEEARGGRKQFHGEREVFRSSHEDEIPASALDGPAKVYSLASYQNLDRVRTGDYYWRFSYLPATEEFRPEKVPIYCTCSMPYNPDTFMLMCGR